MSKPVVYENREFTSDLGRGRAIRSIVYLASVATITLYEFRPNGEYVHEKQIHYAAEKLPQAYLKDKFRLVTPD